MIWVSCLLSNSNTDISLNELALRLSSQNNITIYIDEDLKKTKVSLYVPDKIRNKDFLNLFKNTVKKIDMSFKKNGSFYYLTKNKKILINDYLYKLKYNSFSDCKKLLEQLGTKHIYLEDSNSIFINSTSERYKVLSSLLSQIDVKQNQVILKIMIFEYNEELLKEKGFQVGSIYKDITQATQTALNAIIAPLSTSKRIMSSFDFYGALKLLNQDNILDVKQYPYITTKHNKNFEFLAVENIPYLTSSTKTEATNTSEQTSIIYKDVGLKIKGIPFIYDDYVSLDLDLVIEDLLPTNIDNNMPKTYKRYIHSNTDVNYNDVLLLSGIKRKQIINNNYSIPILSNIPYLGEIFKYKTSTKNDLTIVIAIEVIKDFNSLSSIEDISNFIKKDID